MIGALDEMREAVEIRGHALAEWAGRGAWCDLPERDSVLQLKGAASGNRVPAGWSLTLASFIANFHGH